VLRALASVGCSFDCASAGEIKKILGLGVTPERIIFANTTKMSKHIHYAKECNVKLLTFDNVDEIYKISKIHPNAE
jgi:ornithine decarboxylase